MYRRLSSDWLAVGSWHWLLRLAAVVRWHWLWLRLAAVGSWRWLSGSVYRRLSSDWLAVGSWHWLWLRLAAVGSWHWLLRLAAVVRLTPEIVTDKYSTCNGRYYTRERREAL